MIVEDGDGDEDMEDGDTGTYDEIEDGSEWESYDEPDEEEEEEDNILESIPRNFEGVGGSLQEVPTGGTSTGAAGILQPDNILGGEEEEDMMYSQRTPEVGVDEEESSDEEEENSEEEYPVDPFDDIGQQISRIGKFKFIFFFQNFKNLRLTFFFSRPYPT